MSLFSEYDGDGGPSWSPSHVRRLLVQARTGALSPILRESDGEDKRQAVAGMVGADVSFEALAFDEAFAALDLLAALHNGSLDAFVAMDGHRYWIAPAYWEPRHDAADLALADTHRVPALAERDAFEAPAEWEAARDRRVEEVQRHEAIQRSALLWAEDHTINHPDRPVPAAFNGLAVRIERNAARAWIATVAQAGQPKASSRTRPPDDLFELLITKLNAAGIAKRDVGAPEILKSWDGDKSNVPTVPAVHAAMEGGVKGRPPGKTS